jgi:hypothetical protein
MMLKKNRWAVDLCCGKGGWTRALINRGFRVVGFDTVRFPEYMGELVIQDVRTIDGRNLRGASLIVASPPCQEFSRWRMPWTRAKNPPAPDLSIIHACFYIARAAGVPLVLENVRTAERWIGPPAARWGPFSLWGDGVPALLPVVEYVPKEHYSSKRSADRAVIPVALADWIAAVAA